MEEKRVVALFAAMTAVYFDDSSDYKAALLLIIKTLGGKEAIELINGDTDLDEIMVFCGR